MRISIVICVLIVFAVSTKAQEEQEIDRLTIIMSELITKRDKLNDSIEALKFSISEIKMKALRPEDGEPFCETTTIINATIREEPVPFATQVFIIPKDKIVKVYHCENKYWLISYGDKLGYTNEMYIKITPEMEEYELWVAAENKNKREERIAQETQERKELGKKRKAEKEANAAKRKQRLIDKYGQYTAKRILTRQIWIGMTDEMARESIGSPNDINRSTGSWGIHEQWVYNNKYLYFENGKLTSWQD